MAKAPTLTTIATGYYSTTALNDNFDNIEAAFENTLSLNGATPNAMNADLDMNGYSIINYGALSSTPNPNPAIDTHLNTGTATTGQYLTWDGSDYDWIDLDPAAAGAVMDSELTDLAGVKALDTSTLATLTGTETLTNKTLTTPVINGAVTGTGVGTDTGDLVKLEDVGGSPGLPAVDGSQLTGIGGGATLISTTTLSNDATAEFTLDTSTYENFTIVMKDVIPDTDGVVLECRFSNDGGTTFKSGASDYAWAIDISRDAADDSIRIVARGASGFVVGSDPTDLGITGEFHINGAGTGFNTNIACIAAYDTSGGDPVAEFGVGRVKAAEENGAIQFFFSAGNLESGVITLYGRA